MNQGAERNELLRMTPEQLQEARKLIRKTCANFDDGGNCLLLDDGEPCRCPQFGAYSVICKYFRDAVLPGDMKFHYSIIGQEPKYHCVICGAPIYSNSNRAKYCPDCNKSHQRMMDAAKHRRQYEKRKNGERWV